VNLADDGYLQSFALYWDFSGASLVPNTSGLLWMESNRTNRFNASGLEMETKNALGIYTAAQYGFNKTLPLAITNNSAYYQSAYEGFEDYQFNQSISGGQLYPCNTEQLDFADMQNASVVSSDVTGFRAHTGKYMLQIAHGTSSLDLPIATADYLSYNLQVGSSTTQVLNQPG